MTDMTLDDAEGFYAWAHMLVNNHESYFFPENELQIDFFGSGNSAYLVIDVYTSKNSADHYEFTYADEKDEGKATQMIFEFLKYLDFSLKRILQWLKDADFIDSEMGMCISIFDLHIYRSHIKQTE